MKKKVHAYACIIMCDCLLILFQAAIGTIQDPKGGHIVTEVQF